MHGYTYIRMYMYTGLQISLHLAFLVSALLSSYVLLLYMYIHVTTYSITAIMYILKKLLYGNWTSLHINFFKVISKRVLCFHKRIYMCHAYTCSGIAPSSAVSLGSAPPSNKTCVKLWHITHTYVRMYVYTCTVEVKKMFAKFIM